MLVKKLQITNSKVAAVVMMMAVSLLLVSGASAQSGLGGDGDCEAGGQGTCTPDTNFKFNGRDEDVGIADVAIEILNFLSTLVGVAVLIGVVAGAIMYSTASGNPQKAQKGITIITNSMIGLVVFLLTFVAINFLVPGGIFTS